MRRSPNPNSEHDEMDTKEVAKDSSTDDSQKDDVSKTEETSAGNEDVDMENNPSRAEGFLRFEVMNFSKIKETALSDSITIRNLPWRIMVMPKFSATTKHLGVFVQCDPTTDSASWSCQASAKIVLLNHKNPENTFIRKISHLFFAKENDWGYSNFLPWSEVLDTSKGYIKNDCITLEVTVQAEAPHGVFWDSKKLTGSVGLKNQGATCYMNSLLQTLFFTNQLRRAVYHMPTENDDPTKSVALALQRVFHELQHGDRAVGTKKLTKSFGWETLDSFMQHDVQELCRVLLDNMESKMKGTVVEGTIPKLLEGSTVSYVQCLYINYRSTRQEPFYDVQLNVKGKKNVMESFKEYVTCDQLDGDNKYDAGDHGLQVAKKGVIFKHLPPVLHLHLLRFQYDPVTDTNYKINDRYEFPEQLNLDSFLEGKEETPAHYTLHAVLVHSGDNHGGHYVVYINPKGDGKWFKFDDDVVSQATKKEAIENNFGGSDDEVSLRHCTNAYMLVYIRDSNLDEVLQTVGIDDIPNHLERKFQDEKRLEAQRRKERNEAHLYMTIDVIFEDVFHAWNGDDLFDAEKYRYSRFRVLKSDSLKEVTKKFADALGYHESQVRLWPFQKRMNNTARPTSIDGMTDEKLKLDGDLCDMKIFALNGQNPQMDVFVETTKPETLHAPLPTYDEKNDVLLFIKYYNPKTSTMSYCGHLFVQLKQDTDIILPTLRKWAGLPEDTPLLLFEEVKPSSIIKINHHQRVEEAIQEVLDGDIVCFQRDYSKSDEIYELPTCVEYFKDLLYRVEVQFCEKNTPSDIGFTVVLSLRMSYMQVAKVVASHLSVDPMNLQFFKQHVYRDIPGHPIKCAYDGSLREVLSAVRARAPRKLYYQVLSMPIDVLENKFQFKCTWINEKEKEERELNLFVDKEGLVSHLLHEARHHIDVTNSNPIRLLEIVSSKIQRIVPEDVALDTLMAPAQRSYRVEEILEEELINPTSVLVPVAHFQKDIFNTFGSPFLLKIIDNELLGSLRERVRLKIDMPLKEFEKIKLSLVHLGRISYFPDDDDHPINLKDFLPTSGSLAVSKPFLGLDHVNRAQKRSRYNYLEKAIKIHN